MIEESKSKGSKKYRQNTAKGLAKDLPALDYDLPPLYSNDPSRQDITALQGGNYGDVLFQIHYQFHLSLPAE
jgi:hypothetical protein